VKSGGMKELGRSVPHMAPIMKYLAW